MPRNILLRGFLLPKIQKVHIMITTYDELKSAVTDWLKRSELVDKVPNFIQLAEAHFNRTIRVPEMEARATVSADGEFVGLPSDFLSLREIHVEGSHDRPLHYITPQELTHIEYSGYTANPFAYTILDGQIKLFPSPGVGNELNVEIIYIQKIPALSDSNTSNWLLASHPDIYLYATLLQAEAFLYNDRRMPVWERKADMAIAELNNAGNKARLGAGPMIPRVRNIR